MKKLLSLAILGIFMLTGCGAGATETMSCTYNTNANGLTTKIMYSVDHENNDVKKVRVTYTYDMDNNENTTTNNNTGTNTTGGNNTTGTTGNTDGTNNGNIDGVGTGTDGTTNDNLDNNDGIIDGVVGSAIDSIINGVTDTILDVSGLRDRHTNVQNTYGNMNGFSVQNTNDNTNNHYTVTYVIDYDAISDTDLGTLNLSRDFNTLRSNYISQGFTCK